jgi:hypothetical protein
MAQLDERSEDCLFEFRNQTQQFRGQLPASAVVLMFFQQQIAELLFKAVDRLHRRVRRQILDQLCRLFGTEFMTVPPHATFVLKAGGGESLQRKVELIGRNTIFSFWSPFTRIRSLSYPGLRTTNAGVFVVTRKYPSASVRISSGDGLIARSVATTTTILPTWSIRAFSNGRPEISFTIPSMVAPWSKAATRTNSRTKPRYEGHLSCGGTSVRHARLSIHHAVELLCPWFGVYLAHPCSISASDFKISCFNGCVTLERLLRIPARSFKSSPSHIAVSTCRRFLLVSESAALM